jgi:hypothetical protein
VDKLRTLLARFIVADFTRATIFVVRSWFWLAAETQGIQEKRRCVNAVLRLDPENEPASLLLLHFDRRQPES